MVATSTTPRAGFLRVKIKIVQDPPNANEAPPSELICPVSGGSKSGLGNLRLFPPPLQ